MTASDQGKKIRLRAMESKAKYTLAPGGILDILPTQVGPFPVCVWPEDAGCGHWGIPLNEIRHSPVLQERADGLIARKSWYYSSFVILCWRPSLLVLYFLFACWHLSWMDSCNWFAAIQQVGRVFFATTSLIRMHLYGPTPIYHWSEWTIKCGHIVVADRKHLLCN